MDMIRFFNRYSKSLEEEPIYGEKFLRWLYHHPVGNFCERNFFARRFFSAFVGWWMRRSWTRGYIESFIQKYGINDEAFEEKVSEYRSFDEFFKRRLKKEFRPIAAQEKQLIFPCDGRHRVIESLDDEASFEIKNETFQLGLLLRDRDLEEQFSGGSMLISRLSPLDYHRFHFPCDVVAENPFLIRGAYASVNPLAILGTRSIFWKNKRIRTLLHHPLGNILMLEVGATCVGSIQQTFVFHEKHAKGSEKGYFHFGGSTIVLLFEKGKIRFADDLIEHSRSDIETYAFMGDEMATWL